MASLKKRIAELESTIRRQARLATLQGSTGPAETGGGETEDLARLLRESRGRILSETARVTPITEKMLNDPQNGEFWRRMLAARKRIEDLPGAAGPAS